MNFANNITIVIVSHKSKKKLTNLIKDISNNIKIIIVENSLDKSIEIELSKLGKKIEIILRSCIIFPIPKISTIVDCTCLGCFASVGIERELVSNEAHDTGARGSRTTTTTQAQGTTRVLYSPAAQCCCCWRVSVRLVRGAAAAARAVVVDGGGGTGQAEDNKFRVTRLGDFRAKCLFSWPIL